MFTSEQTEAAARKLWEEGCEHVWWPKALTFDMLDPITRKEFLDVMRRVLLAAEYS